MKSSLDHIPHYKQREIHAIVEIIQSYAKQIGSVEMIILFGSYARGDFVEKDLTYDDHTTYEYMSDFDILIVTKKPTQEKNMRLASKIESVILHHQTIKTPTSIIVEDIHHINKKLEESRYFYLDVKREGVMLYDS